jgi:3'-phosphoadenosine 5'-phosphosulfate sulfotransferase (PAPS reductase)/FAD synthetase
MKKSPANTYSKESSKVKVVGTMADESMLRTEQWIRHGCNAFDGKNPKSAPMSFWLNQDVLAYTKENNLPMAPVYGDIVYAIDPEQIRMDESFCGEKLCTTGCDRTGCIFCGFGAHLEKGEGRFERLKRTHPKLWRYCIYGGGYDPADGLWKPTKEGLGMGHVFDVLNGLYGDGFIPYGKE